MVKRRQFMLYFLAALSIQLAFCFSSAYAESEPSISVSVSEPESWTSLPGTASVADFPISVITNNQRGYTIKMETTGSTTSLELGDGNGTAIPTITLSPGQTSVPLNSMVNSYGYSMDGLNFKPVPAIASDGDLIAEKDNVTQGAVNTHDLIFGVNVSDFAASGDYENTFLITVVAKNPTVCEVGYICYENNGGDPDVTMAKQAVAAGSTEVTLSAPNFTRQGYGFAGWNTKMDGTGVNYGPNEDISATDILSDGLVLYAKWVASVGDLQNWNGCDALSTGAIVGLTDNRDGNTYAVIKMSDGACWMTESLRLDLSDPSVTITSANTNNPTTSFANSINNNHPASTHAFCTNANANCINRINFNSDNVNPQSNSYYAANGVYYNWYTATAGNGTYNSTNNQRVAGDICPANWRLPYANGTDSDFVGLDIAMGGDGVVHNTTADSKRWRKYPINFIYNGQIKNGAMSDIGVSGNYFAAEGLTGERAANLWLLAEKSVFTSNASPKHRGQGVRCMMKKTYTIKYNKNAPSGVTINGTMSDQKMTRGVSGNLSKNTFTHTYANHTLYEFREWNTESDGSGTSYSDEATVLNLAAADGEITLYAQWDVIQYTDLEVVFDGAAISSFIAQSSEYGDVSTSTSGGTVEVAMGKTYTIMFDLDVGYEFVEYQTTSGGTLGSATASPTTYVVSADNTTLMIVTNERVTPLYIQNLDSSVCSSTAKLVTDIRDGQEYLVKRLADGKCWMIDDLRLGSATITQTISSENTNISSNTSFTMPAFSSTLSTNRSTPQANGSKAGQVINHFGDTTGKGGVYYNYCAATAGTVCNHNDTRNATEDICPAGWRLPTGGTGGEQETLFNQFGTVAGMQVGASLTYGGWYNYNSIREFETASWTWSSSGASSNKAHVMFIGRTMKSFTDGASEAYGENIRCVMK